ncbi:hypothetical protein SJAV_18830 [Sulfurisphaera javensis]|uniref:Nucleotidyltransferase n=1 Tax=Sulfurisphaera javensis TaxID=2049879 RepID=A0AAT9GSS7_9CREN
MSGITPFDLQTRKTDVNKMFEDYLVEAERIYNACKKDGVKALLYGSIAVYYKVKDNPLSKQIIQLYRRNGPQDINFLVRQADRDKFKQIMVGLDYTPYFHLEKTLGNIASMFFKEEKVVKVYYFDDMRFSHTIPVDWNSEFVFSDEDLLLSKLQIHFTLDKHLSDIIALMLKLNIEGNKIIELTSSDWGLWKDVTDNLLKARELVGRLIADEVREREELAPVIPKLIKLHGKVMNSPKKSSWKPIPEGEKYWSDF